MRRRGLLFTVFLPFCLVIIGSIIKVAVTHGDRITEIQKFQAENPANQYQIKAELAQIGSVRSSLDQYHKGVALLAYTANTDIAKALEDYKKQDYANFEMPAAPKAKKGKKGKKAKAPDPKINIYFNSKLIENDLQTLRINTSIPIMHNKFKYLQGELSAPTAELNKFLETVKSLENYIRNKKYKKDSGQYLKDQNAIVIEQATAYIKAANDMLDTVLQASHKFDDWRLETVKQLGDERFTSFIEMDIALWNYSLLFQEAQYRGNEDFSSKELQKQADDVIKEIQGRYDTWMKLVKEAKDDPDNQKYKSAEPHVAKLINAYKQFKEHGYPIDELDSIGEIQNAYLASVK